MFLQKLEIENFKSFKSFTEVDFSPKITIIVGRNGSGKSNIIHAIRTVICCEKLSKDDRMDLLHEGNLEETAVITLYIDNSDKRLSINGNLKLKRVINTEKDEYFINDKVSSRKDVQGLLENGGISSLPYFIVQQGKISELINMTDKNRYDLIKNISGALKYEQEKENCLRILSEAEITKKKYTNNLIIINDKLKNLETEKSKMEICKNLEKEKRRYEIAYLQKELVQINGKLEEIEKINDDSNEEYEDLDYELKKVSEKINELERDKLQIEMYFNDLKNNEDNNENIISENIISENIISENIKSENIKSENKKQDNNENIKKYQSNLLKSNLKKCNTSLEKITRQIISIEENFKKYKNEEKEVFIEKTFLKNVINFIKDFDPKKVDKEEEIKNAQNLLEEKQRFVAENKTTTDIFNFDTLNKMIEKRKELWREEKKYLMNEKNLLENVQSNESKLVISGHYSYKVYKDLKNENGVVGCIFDLFDIPDNLISAFEAVAGGFLFNIVVSDDKFIPELIQKVNGNATFIPLNKMTDEEPMEIEDGEIYLLSSKINFEDSKELTPLLNFITKNSYVVPDLKEGNRLSKKYKINVVTPEGDLIRKSGMITGGYDNKSSIIKEYKKIQKQKSDNLQKLNQIRNKISKLSLEIETIEKIQKQNDGSFNEIDLLMSICKFLEEKIRILQGKGHKLQFYDNKLENVTYKSINIKSEIMKIENILDDLKKEKEDLDNEKSNLISFIDILKKCKEIPNLKLKEEKLKQVKNSNKGKKESLISKKQALMEKIGFENTEILFKDLTDQEIASKLKEINEELKKYVFLNRRNLDQWGLFIEQKNDLVKRQIELKENYETILKFIANLDEKKGEKMNLTFEGVKSNFQFFSKKLCNFPVDLEFKNNSLLIKVEGGNKNLSGGQKTMVAIALIFSIQKVDPSPFYIFDEVDANLDEEGRVKLSNLFNTLKDLQFLMTTFREELLQVGDKFIGVSFSEKKSYVSEVDKEVALNFIVQE